MSEIGEMRVSSLRTRSQLSDFRAPSKIALQFKANQKDLRAIENPKDFQSIEDF